MISHSITEIKSQTAERWFDSHLASLPVGLIANLSAATGLLLDGVAGIYISADNDAHWQHSTVWRLLWSCLPTK
jgi:hypothetical protein